MRITSVLSTLLAVSTLSTAWPWPPSLGNLPTLRGIEDLIARQDSNTTTLASSQTSPPETSASTTSPSTSNSNLKSNITTTTTNSIPATAVAGGITLLTPAASQTRSGIYYKVGITATWVWNYTSLLATPTAIDIIASLKYTAGAYAAAPPPFTLALNASFEPTQTFTWDTGAFAAQTPLPVGNYTLVVYDAGQDRGVSAVPAAGKLAVWRGLVFGVYTPQPYVGLENAYVCATCSAAAGRLVGGVIVGVVGGVVFGFMWFGGLAGVF